MPYADVQAFNVLTRLLQHEYVWNPSSNSYMGSGKSQETEGGEGTPAAMTEGPEGAGDTAMSGG